MNLITFEPEPCESFEEGADGRCATCGLLQHVPNMDEPISGAFCPVPCKGFRGANAWGDCVSCGQRLEAHQS